MPTSLKVLIVEDRLTDAELMIYELQRAGYDPEWRRVETEADYLSECRNAPDVILTDHNLPEFGAPRALELLKESGLDIPCIVVTGTISEEVAAQRIKDGAADYILKDRMARLGQAVERALEEKRLRGEKRQSEARKSAILEAALDCIITMDHQGRILEFNPAAERTFGYTSREAVGKDMADLIIPAALRERHRRGLERYLATGEGPVLGQHLELTAMRKSGEEFPAEVAITRIPVDGPALFTAYIRDITKRKRKDEEIGKLAAIVESSTEAIIGFTLEGIITSWNRGAEQLYGYSAEETKGRPFSILIPAEHPDELPGILERLKRGERIDRFESARRHKDGKLISVSVTVSPVKDARGNLIGGSSIARDITEQKRAEKALEAIPSKNVRRTQIRTLVELGVILFLSLAVYGISMDLNLFEGFSAWIETQNPMLDEAVVTFVFLAFALGIFSYRRWRDVNREIVGRAQAEAALRTLHSELEIRVQERTSDLAKSNDGMRLEIVARTAAEQKAQHNLERIRALHDIDTAISSTLDLRGVLDILLEKIDFFFPLAAASTIWMVNKQTGDLEPVACRNLDEKEWKEAMLSVPGRVSRMLPKNNEWVNAPDAQSDKRALAPDLLRRWGLHSLLRTPLLAKGRLLGTLSVFTKQEHEFAPEEIEFINTLAGQAAVAIDNAQLYQEVQAQTAILANANANLTRREEVQRILKDLSQDILSLETDKLLNKLTAGVRAVFGVDVCDVRILDDSQHWVSRGISGVDPSVIPSAKSGSVFGRAQWVVQNRKPLLIPDSDKDARFSAGDTTTQLGLRSYLGVPLCSKGEEVIGVLRVLTHKSRDFTAEEIDLLQQFANGAAAAIENARLYEQTKNQALSLDAANKVKDEFLSVMSHELRTPLSIVMGYAGMLREGTLGAMTEEQKKVLDKMMLRGQDQLSIINDIMQTTQLESRSLFVDNRPVDVNRLLQSLKADYSYVAKNVTLKWNYCQNLPQITTDANKLRQILQNLINNAVKFTPRGEVEISAQSTKDAEAVEFRVTDTGIGIPEQELARVFEKFHQVDSSETRLYGGVGIGLYIVRKFTDLLGGDIKIESEIGQGTTFIVTLPLAPSRPSQAV